MRRSYRTQQTRSPREFVSCCLRKLFLDHAPELAKLAGCPAPGSPWFGHLEQTSQWPRLWRLFLSNTPQTAPRTSSRQYGREKLGFSRTSHASPPKLGDAFSPP